MSADILRRAASLMRERAEAVTHDAGLLETWEADIRDDGRAWLSSVHYGHMVSLHGYPHTTAHIASWHPAVALAVADWLEESADHLEAGEENDNLLPHVCPTALEGLECSVLGQSLAVARAYLGEDA